MIPDQCPINEERFWADLMELGKIGFCEGHGVSRIALSTEDLLARAWLTRKMKTAGLEVREDQTCNMIGLLRTKTPQTTKNGVVGSHLDTVPEGGMFDGALGVIAALECARAFREAAINLPWNLEVINFCDEEGRHHAGTMGSRAMLGYLTEEDLNGIGNKHDKSFLENLQALGKEPSHIHQAIRDPDNFDFFLELHIEQGKLLESKNKNIGAVTGIAGIQRFMIKSRGEAGHAGTFPMHLRDDALVKAAPLFTLVPQWVAERNPEMVGTIGKVTVSPGAPNVIPESCTFIVEIRSQLQEDLDAIGNRLRSYVTERKDFEINQIYQKAPRLLNEEMITTVRKAAKQEGCTVIKMASGAGHDAHTFASSVPTGMIFVPCVNGISHNPLEWVQKEDAVAGCKVMMRTLLLLAHKHQISGR